MCYFSSFGRHATCVEWTELQSILEAASVGIFDQAELILAIDWVGALKSLLVRGIEFSKWNRWSVFTETAS